VTNKTFWQNLNAYSSAYYKALKIFAAINTAINIFWNNRFRTSKTENLTFFMNILDYLRL